MKKLLTLLLVISTLLCLCVVLTACSCEDGEHEWEVVYSNAWCTEGGEAQYRCTKCDEIDVRQDEALGHIPAERGGRAATCTEDGRTPETYCQRCERTLVEGDVIPRTHTAGEFIKLSAPTETAKGYIEYNCTKCDNGVKRYDIPALTDEGYTVDFTGVEDKYSMVMEDGFKIEFSILPYKFRRDEVYVNSWYEWEQAYYIDQFTYSRRTTVIIPETYEGLPVTKIGSSAFCDNTDITAVLIPDTVKEIRGNAFKGCTSLASVTVGNGIQKIDRTAFLDCTALVTNNSDNGVYLGNQSNPYVIMIDYDDTAEGVFTVKDGALAVSVPEVFWNSFDSYELPASLKAIPFEIELTNHTYQSFTVDYDGTVSDWVKIQYGNRFLSFATVTFSDGKTNKTVTEIVFDETVTDIREGIMRGFDAVTSVTLPKSLKSVDWLNMYAPYGSISTLDKLYYNGTVEDWCKIDFKDPLAERINHFYLADGNGGYTEQKMIEVPRSITALERYVFAGFCDVTVVIHSGVTRIGSWLSASVGFKSEKYCCFKYCTGVTVFYEGNESQWEKIQIHTSYMDKLGELEKCYYQAEEPSLSSWLTYGINSWHYNSDNKPEAWFTVTDFVDNKTFVYESTVIEVSDTYWSMLMTLKQNNMLETAFANDPEQLEMIKTSATKAEYVQKLTAYVTGTASGWTVSFEDGKMTLIRDGLEVSYVEVNGRVYVGNKVFFIIDRENGKLIEVNSDENTTVTHTWELSEQ